MITIPNEKLPAYCRKNHIRRLRIFGSVLKGQDTPKSDVDIIVEFTDGYVPGLRFFEIESELSDLFGRQVDLNTPAFLSKYFRDRVLTEAQDCYVE
jgi:hypothetical protein